MHTLHGKCNKESGKHLSGMKLLQVGRGCSTLLNMVLMKLPLQLEACDVKLRMILSIFSIENFLYTMESNEDDIHGLDLCGEDRKVCTEEEPSKGSNDH